MNASPLLVPLLLVLSSFHPPAPDPPTKSRPLSILWLDSLKGDFSFIEQWDYPEGISFNETGQPVCITRCPAETDKMTDGRGIVFDDSLDAYYALIDTTHERHSISCDAWCYEWAGADRVDVLVVNPDSVACTTRTGPGTHCRLNMVITSENCIPVIELRGIASPETRYFHATGGSIFIDRNYWERDTLKARFSFSFHNSIEPGKPVFWRGKIVAEIRYPLPAAIESAAIEPDPQ